MIIETYDADPSDPSLNEHDMKVVMKYFLLLKENFLKYDADRSNSISKKEFGNLLPHVGFQLSEETVGKITALFDDDNSGDMDFAEFATVMFYLKSLEKQINDAGSEIDPAEFHAMLRAFEVKMTPREAKYAYDMATQSGTDFNNIAFADIVDIVAMVKENTAEIVAKAEAERAEERAKMKEEGIKKAVRAAVIFTAEKKADLAALQKNKKKRKIIRAIKEAKGGKWEDPNFPATVESLFPKTPSRAEGIEWLRVTEIESITNPQLCIDGVDEGDVCQGALGDCWFLSALSTVAQSGNDQIQCLFVSFEPKYGFAQCRFYKDGEWRVITIDDRIPCKKGKPCFATCRDPNELWVPLIEKAYAKLHGSFEGIESGVINEALVDLTGEPSESLDIHPKIKWEEMKAFMDEGFYMGCANASNDAGVEEDNGLGILANHAYGVLEFVECQGKQLVKCRNPWGQYEWKGRWSDGSREWTDSIIKELGVVFADDGAFYMSFNDWRNTFNRLYVLRIYIDDIGEKWEKHFFSSAWTEETSGGCINFPTFAENPQYYIKTEEDSEMFISVLQPCHRFRRAMDVKYEPCGVAIVEKKADDMYRQESLAQPELSGYPTSRENCIEFDLKAGQPYIIVPHTYHNKVPMEYYMTIFTQKPAVVEELIATKELPSITETFTNATAGGCTNHPTWINNPQYTIKVKNPGTITVTMQQNSESRADLTHIGLYVWFNNSSKKNLIKKGAIAQSPMTNAASVEATFEAEKGKYTVMPCTFNPGEEITYTVKVDGDALLKDVQVLEGDDHTGKWDEGTNGGCKNHDSWKQNPAFPVKVEEETTVTINLNTDGKTPMGFYVMDPDMNETIHTTKFANTPAITDDVVLPAGQWVIVPATFNPGINKDFRLSVLYHKDSEESDD